VVLNRVFDVLDSDRAKRHWGPWKGVCCVIAYTICFFRCRRHPANATPTTSQDEALPESPSPTRGGQIVPPLSPEMSSDSTGKAGQVSLSRSPSLVAMCQPDLAGFEAWEPYSGPRVDSRSRSGLVAHGGGRGFCAAH